MATASTDWPLLLEPGLREIFTQSALGRPTPQMDRLYGLRTSNKARERYMGAGGFGMWPRFEGSVQYDDPSQGWLTNIVNIEFASGFQVQRSMVDDEQYGTINGWAQSLGDAYAYTREYDAADLFIKAFSSTTYRTGESNLGGDGVVLCSASHPRSPKDSTTQSNTGSLPLTLESWDTTRQAGAALTDDRGLLAGINYDTILVPRELERSARQIFDPRSQYEPGSAEFNVNIFGGTVQVVVWDMLTDANAWFAIDSQKMKRHLIWQERIPLEFAAEKDFDSLLAKYRGYARTGRGFSAWQWIYGQNPS